MESTVRLSSTNNAKIMEDDVALTNLVDFIIPAGEVYNLSKSYVSMNMRLKQETLATGSINDFVLTQKTSSFNKMPPSLVGLVKNINIFAERAGKIEDIRAVGLLKNVLNNLTDSRDKPEMLSNPFAVRDSSFTYCNPFVLKKKQGTDPSEHLEVEVQIPLKDLVNIGNVQAYSTAKCGQTHIHLELENNLQFFQAQGDDFDIGALDAGGKIQFAPTGFLGANSHWGADQTGGVPSTTDFNKGEISIDAQGNLVGWTSDRIYADLKLSPFWVSQALNIVDKTSGKFQFLRLVVNAIVLNQDGTLLLGFDGTNPVVDMTAKFLTTAKGEVCKNKAVQNDDRTTTTVKLDDITGIVPGLRIIAEPGQAGTGATDGRIGATAVHVASIDDGTKVVTLTPAMAGALNNADKVRFASDKLAVEGEAMSKILVGDVVASNVVGAVTNGTKVTNVDAANKTVTLDQVIAEEIAIAAEITFTQAKSTNNADINIKGVDAAAKLNIDAPELVLYKNEQGQVPDQINYTTYFTEEDTTNKGSSLQKVHQSNAAAINCVMVAPKTIHRATSSFQTLDKSRIRVDNKDLQDRDFVNKSSLSYDLKHKTMLNMGEQAQNLTEMRQCTQQAQFTSAEQHLGESAVVVDSLMFPLPPSNRPKMIELNSDKSNHDGSLDQGIIVHSEIERSI